MGEMNLKTGKTIVVLSVCFTIIISLIILKTPLIHSVINYIFMLSGGMALTIILLLVLSHRWHVKQREDEWNRELKMLSENNKQERVSIELRDLSKQKDLDRKKQLADIEFEDFKRREELKK